MDNFSRVLLVRFSSLGDVLLTTPLVRALKRRLGSAEIEYFVKSESAPLLRNNPHISRIHELEGGGFGAFSEKVRGIGESGAYDLVIDLHRNPRSWYTRHRLPSKQWAKMRRDRFRRWLLVHLGIDRYGKLIDPVPVRYFSALDGLFNPPLLPDNKGLEIFLDEADRREANEKLNCDGPLVAISPSAHWPTKRWVPERFAEAADRLAQDFGARPVLLGGPEDAELTQAVEQRMKEKAINVTGKLSIRGAAAAIERSIAFVGNDTGLMHIASALDRPGAAIFGPTTRHLGYYPYRSRLHVVEVNGLKCRPCTKQGDRECPKSHFRCMLDISSSDVLDAVRKSIEEKQS